MTRLIRSAVLAHYVEVARAAGLEPNHMLQAAGLPRSCLQDPDLKIPVSAVVQLLEASARTAGIEDFGLRLAERRGLPDLGPVGLLAREQSTVRKALEVYIRYGWLHAESLALRLEEAADLAIVSLELTVGRPVPARQFQELSVAMLYRKLKAALGRAWTPQAVCFTHSTPQDAGIHRRIFGMPVEFGRDFNGVVCLARDLERANPTADPAMARYIQQYVDSIAGHPRVTLSDEVRQLVSTTLSSGRCSLQQVAAQLGVDRRTVHRRLVREGETFSTIVDAVRTEAVTRVLQNRDRPLYMVAESLGFSALSAFSRWFRTRFGRSASAWRAAHAVRARRPFVRRRRLTERLGSRVERARAR
jgi:AraC-like DNA-binding protein